MDTKMKATKIKPDDVLLDENGTLVYTVLAVTRDKRDVIATVQWELDRGIDMRVWDIDQDVPLQHPTATS